MGYCENGWAGENKPQKKALATKKNKGLRESQWKRLLRLLKKLRRQKRKPREQKKH